MKDDLESRLKQLENERSQIIHPINKVNIDINKKVEINNVIEDFNIKKEAPSFEQEDNFEKNVKLENYKLEYYKPIPILKEKKDYNKLYKDLTPNQVKLLLIKNGYI